MRFRFVSFMAILATAGLVNGANIINATGPSPFGFGGAQVFVTARAQGLTYTNLMNQIGPGNTATKQVALPVAISGLTNAFTSRTPFSGLTLAAGKYFLVLVPTNAEPSSMSPEGSGSSGVAAGTSVSFLGLGNTALSPAAVSAGHQY
jgi:hypothetical protein